MPSVHIVRAGEHLAAIAAQEGFSNPATILNHPDNAALAARPQPNLLDPGDELTIPDKTPFKATVGTGSVHKFTVAKAKPKLKVAFKTFRGDETLATDSTLSLDGGEDVATPLAAGALEAPIPPTCTRAVIKIPAPDDETPELIWAVQVGGLGRADSDDGAFARLRNLGYYRTVAADADERERRSAVEEFQADHDVALSGQLDDATRAKLIEIHGC